MWLVPLCIKSLTFNPPNQIQRCSACPNLTCFHVSDGGLGVTVGWIEAKAAGGLSKLKEVVYGCQNRLQDEVRFCMSQ